MPFLGLFLLIADVLCLVHVIKTGRPYYWIFVILGLPPFGMLAYLAFEILPEWSKSRRARQAASGIGRALDPERGLREATQRLLMTPTAENKARLADEFVRAARYDQAVRLYREALTGIHATDPGTMLGLARALFAQRDFAEAQAVLEKLREANPSYNSPEGHLLYARSLELQGRIEAALYEYAALVHYYPGQEARCRYALLLEQAPLGRGAPLVRGGLPVDRIRAAPPAPPPA